MTSLKKIRLISTKENLRRCATIGLIAGALVFGGPSQQRTEAQGDTDQKDKKNQGTMIHLNPLSHSNTLESSEPDSEDGRRCAQVLTTARNRKTNECRIFPTPCDVPKDDWEVVDSCKVYLPIISNTAQKKIRRHFYRLGN